MISLSTGWQPRGTVQDAVTVAQQQCQGVIEVHRLSSPNELAKLEQLRADGKLRFSSIHAMVEQYLWPKSSCSGEDISSLCPSVRSKALDAMKRTIEFAEHNRAPVIVFHAGTVRSDDIPVDIPSRAYERRMVSGEGQVDLLLQSLQILQRYLQRSALAIENQRTLSGIPLPSELATVLAATPPRHVGYWHDVAHARALERDVGIPRRAWLSLAGNRLRGCHIQDSTCSGQEHMPLGCGDDVISRETLPVCGTLVLEVSSEHSEHSVIRSLNRISQMET